MGLQSSLHGSPFRRLTSRCSAHASLAGSVLWLLTLTAILALLVHQAAWREIKFVPGRSSIVMEPPLTPEEIEQALRERELRLRSLTPSSRPAPKDDPPSVSPAAGAQSDS